MDDLTVVLVADAKWVHGTDLQGGNGLMPIFSGEVTDTQHLIDSTALHAAVGGLLQFDFYFILPLIET